MKIVVSDSPPYFINLDAPTLPASVKHWTLTMLCKNLIKIGGKMVRPDRYVIFQLGEHR